MNNPVLLPKRKDYGFLKAPHNLPKIVPSSTGPFKITTKKGYIAQTCKPINIIQKLGNLQIKYELGHANFHDFSIPHSTISSTNSPSDKLVNANTNTEKNIYPSTTTAKSAKLSQPDQYVHQSTPPSLGLRSNTMVNLKAEHAKRQTYLPETGVNFPNLLRQHSTLNFPARSIRKSRTPTSSTLSSNHNEMFNIKPDYSYLKNEAVRIKDCYSCGVMNYYDNNCLTCKFRSKLMDVYAPKYLKSKKFFNQLERQHTISAIRSNKYLDDNLESYSTFKKSTNDLDDKSNENKSSNQIDDLNKEQTNDKKSNNNEPNGNEEDDDVIPKLTLWLV